MLVIARAAARPFALLRCAVSRRPQPLRRLARPPRAVIVRMIDQGEDAQHRHRSAVRGGQARLRVHRHDVPGMAGVIYLVDESKESND